MGLHAQERGIDATEKIHVRVHKDLLARIRAAASEAGATVSEWMRKLALAELDRRDRG